MVRPAKGSKEAKEWGEKMRAMRGGNKISRPVEKGKPEPAKVKGGKIPSPPSRSYNTAQEDKIDGIMISGGSLKDCPTCCGCGIVKLMKKGYTG
jgi:hypothetical protein